MYPYLVHDGGCLDLHEEVRVEDGSVRGPLRPYADLYTREAEIPSSRTPDAPIPSTFPSYGIRAKVMSIQSCQVVPSSLRSHLAVMRRPSGLTVSVDRTAPLTVAELGWAAGAMSPPPVNVHTP